MPPKLAGMRRLPGAEKPSLAGSIKKAGQRASRRIMTRTADFIRLVRKRISGGLAIRLLMMRTAAFTGLVGKKLYGYLVSRRVVTGTADFIRLVRKRISGGLAIRPLMMGTAAFTGLIGKKLYGYLVSHRLIRRTAALVNLVYKYLSRCLEFLILRTAAFVKLAGKRLAGLVPRPVAARAAVFRQWFLGQSLYRRTAMGVAAYFIIVLSAYAAFGPNACAVKADGRLVAVAVSEKGARSVLGEMLRVKTAEAGCPVSVSEKISYEGIRVRKDGLVEDQESLKSRLNENLTFTVKAAAIQIDGEEKVFFRDMAEAEELLAWLKSLYPADSGEQVGFKETVEVVAAAARMESVIDLETAKKKILLGPNKVQEYTVKDGDTLWDIARAVKIDMYQIMLSNPGMSEDFLSIGQVLYLSKEAPMITVVASRDLTVEEEIPSPVEVRFDDRLLPGERQIIAKGVSGERVVTYRIIKENGLETDREILSQAVIREATTEVVAKSPQTILLASRGGSIRLNWPCYGGIGSRFGMRWGRMHEGIDINAGYGSNVVAAGGGIVTFAGWNGGYGKTVDISHGGGVVTRYAHLSVIKVSRGERVDRGELIGLIGSTGYSTGPHLHFEVHINGVPRNPANYLY